MEHLQNFEQNFDEVKQMASVASSSIDTEAKNYVNDEGIEFQWAMKAYQHAEVYFNILTALDCKLLKLTKMDDVIYEEFRALFPINKFRVDRIDEDELKSNESKEKWRPFCESYNGKVEDYNMATLLRINATGDYTEDNTTLVPRIQFFAIEIARNREGTNAQVRQLFKKST